MIRAWAAGALAIFALWASGCSTDAPPIPTGSASSAVTTPMQLSLSLPAGASLHQLAVVSNEMLQTGIGSSVVTPSAGFAAIASSGAGATNIGGISGDVWSEGPTTLLKTAQVNGVLNAAGSVTLVSGAVVTGGVHTAVLTPVQPFSWTIDVATGNDFALAEGGAATLAPGDYGAVSVEPHATLTLTAGTYIFDSLREWPNANVAIDSTSGPVFLYVVSSLDLKSPITSSDPAGFLLGYFGGGTISIPPPFSGTIVASNAGLDLSAVKHGSGDPDARGSFFAKDITIDGDARVEFNAFSAWDIIFPPIPIVECDAHFDATHDNVLLGYTNPLDVPVTISIGTRNNLVPANTPPITAFQPGLHDNVFFAFTSTGTLTWTLGGTSVTADSSTRRCTSTDLPPLASQTPGTNGEGASPPRPSILPIVQPDIRKGVTVIGSVTQSVRPATPSTLPFRVIIDGQTFGSDAACGPRQLYVVANVNGQDLGRHDLPGCTNPGACGVPIPNEVLQVDIPTSQPTVAVSLDVWEVDTEFCGGDDDHELNISFTVDTATGQATGGYSTFDPDSSQFLTPGQTTATNPDGFGISWLTVPTLPRVCSSWNAQYVDSGPEAGFSGVEDFAATSAVQALPASFARAALFLRRGTTETYRWEGVLDKDGCVPQAVSPSADQWALQAGAGASGLTTIFLQSSEMCFDPSGNECAPDATGTPTGARFRAYRNFEGGDTPNVLCTAWSQDTSFSSVQVDGINYDCDIHDEGSLGAFPNWNGTTYPSSPVNPSNPSEFETTRLAGVASQILKLEAEGAHIGITEALLSGSTLSTPLLPPNGPGTPHNLIELEANAICPPPLNDTCADDPINYRGDTTVTERDGTVETIPGDTFWKFVIAHEIGHVIERRAIGEFSADYDEKTPMMIQAPAKCSCDHVAGSNEYHCLQSVELAGAVQAEGYAQFFTSRVWNRADQSDCTFQYYKEFLNNGCMPGVPGDGCFTDPASGLIVSKPPIPIDCSAPVRWRNGNCLDSTVTSGELVTDLGTEYDWMGFLYGANTQTPNNASMSDLFEIYKTACGGAQACSSKAINFETCTNCATPGGLKEASVDYFNSIGEGVNGAKFSTLADLYGVSRATTP